MTDRQIMEKSWRENKYLVMYHHQQSYEMIRALLKADGTLSEYHTLLTQALAHPPTPGSKMNAYQHVWGYFKKKAAPEEKQKALRLLDNLEENELLLNEYLYQLAQKYAVQYLLDSTLLNHSNNA